MGELKPLKLNDDEVLASPLRGGEDGGDLRIDPIIELPLPLLPLAPNFCIMDANPALLISEVAVADVDPPPDEAFEGLRECWGCILGDLAGDLVGDVGPPPAPTTCCCLD